MVKGTNEFRHLADIADDSGSSLQFLKKLYS